MGFVEEEIQRCFFDERGGRLFPFEKVNALRAKSALIFGFLLTLKSYGLFDIFVIKN